MSKVRVNIYGEIGWDINLANLAPQVPRNAKEIFVHINSVGGDVEEGFAIMNFLQSHPGKVTTVIEGMCYSIATVIALAGDERRMFPTAELMIHNPWGSVTGDAEEIARYSEWIQKAETKLIAFYASRLDMTPEEVAQKMNDTTFIDSSEAYSLGFTTEEAQQYKAVAKLNNNNNSMEKLNEADKSWLAKQFEKLAKLFPSAKAMLEVMVVSEEGEFPVFIDSTDGEIEGKSVYLDEDMTQPAPQGVHMLRDGREITVNAEGIIDSVREASSGEGDHEEPKAGDMEKENEELKAQLAAMKEEMAKMTEAKAQNEEAVAKAKAENEGLMSKLSQAEETVAGIKAKFATLMDTPPGKGEGDGNPPQPKPEEGNVFALGVKALLEKANQN